MTKVSSENMRFWKNSNQKFEFLFNSTENPQIFSLWDERWFCVLIINLICKN